MFTWFQCRNYVEEGAETARVILRDYTLDHLVERATKDRQENNRGPLIVGRSAKRTKAPHEFIGNYFSFRRIRIFTILCTII